MTIRHIPYFVMAAEEENFQRAAARLNMTQPALSRRIQDLEAALGVRLFDRTQGRVRLTPAGQAFRADAARLLEDFNASITRLRHHASLKSQSLAIGFNEHAMRISPLTEAVRTFRSRHPQVEISLSLLSSEEQLQSLKDGSLDLALLHLTEDEAAPVESREIRQNDPYVIALPKTHRLAQRAEIRLADLAGEELIWPSTDRVPALHRRLLEAWRAAGLEPRITTQITSAEAALNAVAAGLGIAVVRQSNAGREPASVALRSVNDLQVNIGIRLAWLGNALCEQRDSFIALLASQGVIRDSAA